MLREEAAHPMRGARGSPAAPGPGAGSAMLGSGMLEIGMPEIGMLGKAVRMPYVGSGAGRRVLVDGVPRSLLRAAAR